jgi:hypothetical protein
MNLVLDKIFLRIFFGLAACSWMPHWACHYYRLETQSTFIVGSWAFSFTDCVVSLFIYSILIAVNLLSISAEKFRIVAATHRTPQSRIASRISVALPLHFCGIRLFTDPWRFLERIFVGCSVRLALIIRSRCN